MVARLSVFLLACLAAALPAVPADRRPTPPPKPAPLKASSTVRRWMRGMTLHDEVAQLVFIMFHGESPNTTSREYRKFIHLIRETKVGGLILNNVSDGRTIRKAEPYQVATFLNRLQRMTRVPLMVAGDFERGASMRVAGTTEFPHAMAFGAAGDPALTRYEGQVTAREARAIGVEWIYYPVADVNNNPDNPIINIRSFGENPQDVAAHVRAFIEGAHADKKNLVLATAKHFPGHGDTAVDTHMNLATIPADRERLDRVELVPFKAAIDAGVDAIMTAHIAVPALAPPDLPATLSPAILTDLLRKQLGFKGLVVTDALEMGGIAKGFSTGDACVRALEAGADTLLMPTDADVAVKAVVAAVGSGRLTRQRIQESVIKILSAKEKVGLDRSRVVNLEAIGDVIDSPEAGEKAQEIADRAITLVRNAPVHGSGGLLPLAEPEKACYVVMPESRYTAQGQMFTQQLHRRVPRLEMATLDPSMPREQIDEVLGHLSGCQSYAVAAFSAVSENRGSVGLAGELPHAMETIAAAGKPVALVALGNPYLLRNFSNVTAYVATFSTVPPSENAAVKALFGEIKISGHLPVTIPGLAASGDGIQMAATRSGPPVGPTQ
ncbi:MAG: glycoside hydrolase family 3 N-terminal domain-containing protein [Bryobacteraceae bacterium]